MLELNGFEITKAYAIDSMPPSVAIMMRSHDLQSAKRSRRGDREFLTYLAAALEGASLILLCNQAEGDILSTVASSQWFRGDGFRMISHYPSRRRARADRRQLSVLSTSKP
jgi:hypothetical protein